MKRILLITAFLLSAIFVFAQRNEIRIVYSSDIFEPVYTDYLPQNNQFSIGFEYSRAISKQFEIETGLMYSKAGFMRELCDFCHPGIWPVYLETKEINAKIGMKWNILEKGKMGLYTSLGIQGDRKIDTHPSFELPEEDHFSGSLYQDLGIRLKLNKRFSLDLELKGRYNLPDETSIYYNKRDLEVGLGVGVNYSF